MTRRRSNAVHSVQTESSVQPFRKGTARQKAFKFLSHPRTIEEFNRWTKRIGANPQNLLRVLRKSGKLVENDGTLRME
jgi:hypothetical protein